MESSLAAASASIMETSTQPWPSQVCIRSFESIKYRVFICRARHGEHLPYGSTTATHIKILHESMSELRKARQLACLDYKTGKLWLFDDGDDAIDRLHLLLEGNVSLSRLFSSQSADLQSNVEPREVLRMLKFACYDLFAYGQALAGSMVPLNLSTFIGRESADHATPLASLDMNLEFTPTGSVLACLCPSRNMFLGNLLTTALESEYLVLAPSGRPARRVSEPGYPSSWSSLWRASFVNLLLERGVSLYNNDWIYVELVKGYDAPNSKASPAFEWPAELCLIPELCTDTTSTTEYTHNSLESVFDWLQDAANTGQEFQHIDVPLTDDKSPFTISSPVESRHIVSQDPQSFYPTPSDGFSVNQTPRDIPGYRTGESAETPKLQEEYGRLSHTLIDSSDTSRNLQGALSLYDSIFDAAFVTGRKYPGEIQIRASQHLTTDSRISNALDAPLRSIERSTSVQLGDRPSLHGNDPSPPGGLLNVDRKYTRGGRFSFQATTPGSGPAQADPTKVRNDLWPATQAEDGTASEASENEETVVPSTSGTSSNDRSMDLYAVLAKLQTQLKPLLNMLLVQNFCVPSAVLPVSLLHPANRSKSLTLASHRNVRLLQRLGNHFAFSSLGRRVVAADVFDRQTLCFTSKGCTDCDEHGWYGAFLPTPRVKVRRGETILTIAASACALWNSLGLAPLDGERNVLGICIVPQPRLWTTLISKFQSAVSDIWTNFRFGNHRWYSLDDEQSTDFRIRNDIAVAVALTLKSLGTVLISAHRLIAGKDMSFTKDEHVVIYIFSPLSPAALPPIMDSIEAQVENFPAMANWVFEVLPMDFMTQAIFSLHVDAATRVVHEVYGQLPADPLSSQARLSFKRTSATVLATEVSSDLHLDSDNSLSLRTLTRQKTIHVAYRISIDKKWTCATWSDMTGEYQHTACYALDTEHDVTKVIREIWETTLDLIRPCRAKWTVTLAKDVPYSEPEEKYWIDLVDRDFLESQVTLHVVLFHRNAILPRGGDRMELQNTEALSPAHVTIVPPTSMLMQNGIEPSPSSTPNAQAASPDSSPFAAPWTHETPKNVNSNSTPVLKPRHHLDFISVAADPLNHISPLASGFLFCSLASNYAATPRIDLVASSARRLRDHVNTIGKTTESAMHGDIDMIGTEPLNASTIIEDTLMAYRDLAALAVVRREQSHVVMTPWHLTALDKMMYGMMQSGVGSVQWLQVHAPMVNKLPPL